MAEIDIGNEFATGEEDHGGVGAGPAIDVSQSMLIGNDQVRIIFGTGGVAETITPGAWTAIRYAPGGNSESIAYLGYLPGDVDGNLDVEQMGNSAGDGTLLACWVDSANPPAPFDGVTCTNICGSCEFPPDAPNQWDINRDGALTADDVDTWVAVFSDTGDGFDDEWDGETLPEYGACCLDPVLFVCENATSNGCGEIGGASDVSFLCGESLFCSPSP